MRIPIREETFLIQMSFSKNSLYHRTGAGFKSGSHALSSNLSCHHTCISVHLVYHEGGKNDTVLPFSTDLIDL